MICVTQATIGEPLTENVRNNMQMIPLTGYPSLYIKKSCGNTIGVFGTNVDDCLFAGNLDFNEVIKKTQTIFESKQVEWNKVKFLGVKIVTRRENNKTWFEMNQIGYIERLQQIPVNAAFERFRSVRASLSWLCHTRPDICCAVNRACQVVEKKFNKSKIRAINKLIQRLKKSKDTVLKYLKLDLNTIHFRVHSDFSFASNDDGSSQLGYIILLCDEINKCYVLSYCCKKSKRIVRSIMAGEIFAFSAAFDQDFVIRHDLEAILNQKISLTMFTDSEQLFDVLTTAAHTTEKRLMVEIMAAREAYSRFEISNVSLVSGNSNTADGLMKPRIFAPLDELLHRRVVSTNVEKWIYGRSYTIVIFDLLFLGDCELMSAQRDPGQFRI